MERILERLGEVVVVACGVSDERPGGYGAKRHTHGGGQNSQNACERFPEAPLFLFHKIPPKFLCPN
jgi:hypothetical protein